MALDIQILVGTMTGTAQLVAQELELAFGDDEVAIHTTLMDGLDGRIFDRPGIFLICTSTYGHGDVPDNAKALYADLVSRKPDLSHVRYGVFALGDRTHVGTFCYGGKHFDEALSALGAQRVGEVAEHDASGGTLAEDAVLEWFPQWLDSVRSMASSAAISKQAQ
jgi:MioC protein